MEPNETLEPYDMARAEIHNKRIVIYSLCGIAWLCVITICVQAVRGYAISDNLDRLATSIVSVIAGMLIKTGSDRVFSHVAKTTGKTPRSKRATTTKLETEKENPE